MADIKEALDSLLKEGRSFNFTNSCTLSRYGNAESYKSEYISWKTRTETLLTNYFGIQSPVFKQYQQGQQMHVLGYGPYAFNQAHNQFLGAVHAAKDLIDFDMGVETKPKPKAEKLSNKIFVVHGHDEKLKQEVELFLTQIGLEPIVLHRQPDQGQTLIEKFEKNSNVGYALILLTPDDIGYPSTEESKDEKVRKKNFRARQNVIFEFGYFVGKLGRQRVCCLYKEDIELPTDISGIMYKKVINKVDEVAFSIIKDLKAVGYSLNI